MIFKKLELKNFKSHANTTLNFTNGISLIIGENGAGKSSIFEAITFALFKKSDVTNFDLVRTNKDSRDQIEMSVKLTFNVNGTDYRVERFEKKRRNNTTGDAFLYKITTRDELIAAKTNNVNKEIKELLNMDSETFLNAIHIKQGEISNLIDKGASERKKLIGKLLRIDDLETAHKKMPKIMKGYELARERLEGQITPENELNNELNTLKNQETIIQGEITKLNNELEEITKENETKTTEKENLNELKSKLDALIIKHNNEEENYNQLNKRKEELSNKYEEIINKEKEMEELKPFCDKLQTYTAFKESFLNYNNIKRDETLKNEIIGEITKHKTIISTEKEKYEKYLELENELGELNNTLTTLNTEIKANENIESEKEKVENNIIEHKDSLSELINDCKTILSNFDEIDDIDFETIKLDELEKIVEKFIAKAKKKIEEIDAKISENNNQISSLTQDIESSKEPLAEIKKVENKCPTCQSEISEDKKNELINSYNLTISDNTKKMNEITDLNNALRDKKSLKNNELDDLESIKNNINKNLHIPKQIDELTSKITEFDEKIEEVDSKKEKHEELSKTVEEKTNELKNLETNYKNYVDAKTILHNLDEEEKVKNELNIILDAKTENEDELNQLIDIASDLSLEINEEELNNEISILTEKNTRYNVLKGSVKDKEEYETKIKENEEEIKTKENKIKELKNKIESCEYDEKTHETINKLVEELGNKISKYNTNIAVYKANLENNSQKINEINTKIEENKEYIDEFNAISDYLYLLNDFKHEYSKDGVQKELRSQSKPLIQKYTREFFEKFNFNYSDLTLSNEYNISIYGPEGKVKLGMVSGGEKISIALSLRLAITQVMSQGNIETILLDEPTIHLDSYRRQELINVLRSMSIIPQMIIVTHDSELETAADTLIKISKEDGISKIEDD